MGIPDPSREGIPLPALLQGCISSGKGEISEQEKPRELLGVEGSGQGKGTSDFSMRAVPAPGLRVLCRGNLGSLNAEMSAGLCVRAPSGCSFSIPQELNPCGILTSVVFIFFIFLFPP